MKKLLSYLLLPVSILLIINTKSYSQGWYNSTKDSIALALLHRVTYGDNWSTYKWIWPPQQSPRYWYGVTVSNSIHRRVIGLSLPNNNLVGQLPSEIGNLTACKELNLEGNKLYGILPPEMSNMDSLQILNLSHNQLVIPLPNFMHNEKLRVLELSDNEFFRAIPASLGLAGSLEVLDLSDNRFSDSIPDSFSNLDNLKVLNLAQNELEGEIPALIFSDMEKLEELLLINNHFEGEIPGSIGGLTSLKLFDISGNQLSGSWPYIVNGLPKLEELNISHNSLNGPLPAIALSQLPSLIRLDLSDNMFDGEIPEEIESLESLEYLMIENNNLVGEVPESFSKLSNLRGVCSLSGNYLTGFESLNTFPELNILNLSQNRFTFEDIVPILNVAGHVNYSPQREIGTRYTMICEPDDFKVLRWIGNEGSNTYQWYKDGVEIPGATSGTLMIPDIDSDDEANYTIKVKNPKAPLLTLESFPITLTVQNAIIDGFSTDPAEMELIVNSMTGAIDLSRINQDDISLSGGEILYQNDRLESKERANVYLVNSDFSQIMLNEMSEMNIQVPDTAIDNSSNGFYLTSGSLNAKIIDKANPAGRFHFASPNGLVSSSEANLGFAYDKVSNTTTLNVSQGQVKVIPDYSPADSVIVKAGQTVTISTSSISPVADYTLDRIEIFKDTIHVPVDGKRLLFVSGFDVAGNSSSIEVDWVCSGGSFGSGSNAFYAGQSGVFDVFATEPGTGLTAKAVIVVGDGSTGIPSLQDISGNLSLSQNYPNPFTYKTTIDYQLNKPGKTSLIVYNYLGEIVEEFVSKDQAAGKHSVDFYSKALKNGAYFYKLESEGSIAVKRMFLLR